MKVALIEDRIDRLNKYADPRIKEIAFLNIITEEKFNILAEEIAAKIYSQLDIYDCLMLHRSAFDNESRQMLKTYCEKNNKPLVFFSGSISSSMYQDSNFPILYINSKDFYSSNLILFLTDLQNSSKANLLILQFGERWRLNLLLTLRNKTNYKVQSDGIKRIRDLEIPEHIIDELKSKFTLEWLDKRNLVKELTSENIRDFKEKINTLINDAI